MQVTLDHDLLILLNDVARLMRTRADQLARAHGMTRAQWVILVRLAHTPGLSQNELAGLCEVEPITVARLIDRLEARDLLERRFDPSDRRIRRLYLRPAAQPILKEMEDVRERVRSVLLDGVSDAEKNLVTSLLLRMKSNLCKSSESQKAVTAAE